MIKGMVRPSVSVALGSFQKRQCLLDPFIPHPCRVGLGTWNRYHGCVSTVDLFCFDMVPCIMLEPSLHQHLPGRWGSTCFVSQRSSNHHNHQTKSSAAKRVQSTAKTCFPKQRLLNACELSKHRRIILLMIYKSCVTLRTLNYGNYGIVLIMGILQEFRSSAGIIPVAEESYKPGRKRAQGDAKRKAPEGKPRDEGLFE